MTQNLNSPGLRLAAAEPDLPVMGRDWLSWVAALTLLLAAQGCLYDLAGTPELLPAALAGAALLALCLPLRGRDWAARFLKPALIPLTCCAGIAGRSFTLNGIALLCNRLFAASEAVLSRPHTPFAVTAPADRQQFCLLWAALLFSLLWAEVSIWLLRGRLWMLALAAALGFAALVAYLGLAPALWWCLALAVGCTLPLIGNRERFLPLLPALLALGLLTLFVLPLPAENPRISALEASLRDAFSSQSGQLDTEREHNEQEQTPQEPPEEPSGEEPERPSEDVEEENAPRDNRFLPAALLLLSLLLWLSVLLALRLHRRTEQKRQGLNDPDCAAAVRAMFLYAADWLRACGFGPEHENYEDWPNHFGQLPEEYVSLYREMLPLWQQAAYSAHPPEEAQRERMKAFLRCTGDTLWQRASLRQRLHIRVRLALRRERPE